MNSFAQEKLYSEIFIYSSFILILLYSISLITKNNFKPTKNESTYSILLLIILSLFWGSYPYTPYSDRHIYLIEFENVGENFQKEIIWMYYNWICNLVLTPKLWLYLTAFIYTYGIYTYCKKIHPNYQFTMMLGFLGFLFINGYATNTMRAGIAFSIIMIALTKYYSNKKLFIVLLFIASNIHFSMLLPFASLIYTKNKPKTNLFLKIWWLSIPLSLVGGTYFQVLFAPILGEYSGGKATGYLMGAEMNAYKSGFRIDFIIYSFIPILMGYYYIFKERINDSFYKNIFNTYLLCNSFWILIIRADYSDRIAYLSWMFIPIILLFPPLKYLIWKQQNVKVATILIFQALFSFLLSIR